MWYVPQYPPEFELQVHATQFFTGGGDGESSSDVGGCAGGKGAEGGEGGAGSGKGGSGGESDGRGGEGGGGDGSPGQLQPEQSHPPYLLLESVAQLTPYMAQAASQQLAAPLRR